MQHTRVFHVDAAECWKTNPMGLFGGSFAVWPTGNSIDFKICLREKASGQKGGELDGGDMGKERKLFRGWRSMHPVERGGRWRTRVRLRKCADHFSGTRLSCSTTIMRMWHNGDRGRRGYCARCSMSTKSSHFYTLLNFLVLSVFRESKFIDALLNAANIDETSMKHRLEIQKRIDANVIIIAEK